jgi:hypothetical protein
LSCSMRPRLRKKESVVGDVQGAELPSSTARQNQSVVSDSQAASELFLRQLRESVDDAGTAAELFLRQLKDGSAACPPLQSAAFAVLAILEMSRVRVYIYLRRTSS